MPTWTSVGEEVIVPRVELPPTVPFTSQVTAVSVLTVEFIRLTTAVKSVWALSATLAEGGVMEIDEIFVELPPQAERAKAVMAESKNVRVEVRLPINGPPPKKSGMISRNGKRDTKMKAPPAGAGLFYRMSVAKANTCSKSFLRATSSGPSSTNARKPFFELMIRDARRRPEVVRNALQGVERATGGDDHFAGRAWPDNTRK